MGVQAEAAGVDILSSCAAVEVRFGANGSVCGVTTQDMGIGKNGVQKESYLPGCDINARTTFFAEGCRGSLSEVRSGYSRPVLLF